MGKLVSFILLTPYVRYCLALDTFKKIFLIFSFQDFDKWCVLVVILILSCLAFVQLLESVRLYFLLYVGSFQVNAQVHVQPHPSLLFFQDSGDTNVKYGKSHMFWDSRFCFFVFSLSSYFCLDWIISVLVSSGFAFSLLCAPHSVDEPIHQLKNKIIF